MVLCTVNNLGNEHPNSRKIVYIVTVSRQFLLLNEKILTHNFSADFLSPSRHILLQSHNGSLLDRPLTSCTEDLQRWNAHST